VCQSCPVHAATVIAILLAVLLAAAVVAVVVLARRLDEAHAEVGELRDALEAEQATPRGPRAVQAAQAAGLAVKSVVETATRMRDQGVRKMLLSSIDDLAAWAMEDRNEIARIAAPDGTVTMMFSDIENSTAVNSEIGDEQWVKLLGAHDRLVRTYVDRHRGHIVKSQGDGYMVVFPTSDLAILASLGIQRALSAKRQRNRRLRRTPIRVRIGLHTGTAIEREGDYFGRNVAMTARVAAMADGGEILVTGEIAEELADATQYRFVPDESVELKGLPGEHQLWLVEAS
jgi:adenylate cyclase